MTTKVLIAHAIGEAARAEKLAEPIRKAGYEVVHEGTIVVGDSVVTEAGKLLTDGCPVVLCATVKAMGTKWARQVANAARKHAGVRLFVVQMEEEADTDTVTFDEVIARHWQDVAKAEADLVAALLRHYPTVSEVQQTIVSSFGAALTAEAIRSAVGRSAAEGLGTPAQWFSNWSGDLCEPHPPPDHWLLKSCFIDTGIREHIKTALRNGQVSGITGFVGMGGVGKTFTALRIAHDLTDEGWQVCWVSLLQQTIEDALDIIAENFGLRFVANLSKPEKVAALQTILSMARHRWLKLLIVLDNAEQFPEFHVVLQALPGQTVLVTSRTREQEAVINYREIAPLKGELAVELCTRFLKGKMGTPEEWHPTEVDREDLDSLVTLYGGHPLSLRTVLAGFVKFPMSARRSPRPFLKVLKILKDKGLKGFETNEVQRFSAREPSEQILRHNLNATFQWLYDDLNAPRASKLKRCAHLLLPVCAVVGTAFFTHNALRDGIRALRGYVTRAQDSQNDSDSGAANTSSIRRKKTIVKDNGQARQCLEGCSWVELIVYLDESKAAVTAALQQLEELSLLQSVPHEVETFALHPTVREFAFEQEDPTGVTRPSSELLLKMALGVIGESGLSDALLDLLPRLKENRQLVEQATENLKSRWSVTEKHGNWRNLRLWAEAILDLTTGLGLQDSIIWVKCCLGELLDRMGEAAGLPMIYEGLCMRLAQGKRITFKPPPFDQYDRLAGIELCRHIGYADNPIAWAAAYLLTSQFCHSSRQDIVLFADHLRAVIDQDSSAYTWNRIPEGLSEMLDNRSSRMLNPAFSDNSTSNAYALLGDLFHRWTLYPASGQIMVLAEDIARTVTIYSAYAEDEDDAKLRRTGRKELTPQHWLYLCIHFVGFKLLSGEMSLNAFAEEIARLRKFSQEQGIRFFGGEMHAWRYRGLLRMVNEEWQLGAHHFGLALSSLSEITGSGLVNETSRDELSLLQLACSVLAGESDVTTAALIEGVGERARKREDDAIRPLFQLALACFHWKQGSLSDCSTAAMNSLASYRERYGRAPLFAEALLGRLCGEGASSTKKEESWRPWSLDWDELPERVVSEIDGRTMTLIRPGVQFIESGKRRVGMWPFYIDDTPLSLAELKVAAQSIGLGVATKKRAAVGDLVSSIAGETWDAVLKKIQKDLPTAEESFAAWLQIEKGISRDSWRSHETIDEALLNEVERRLVEQPTEPHKHDWSEILGSGWAEGVKVKQKARRMTPEKSLELFKNHNEFHWVTGKPAFRRLYKQKFLTGFYASEVMSHEEKAKLAELTATSLSLSEAEKHQVYRKAATLSRTQCNDLMKVFIDERSEFERLLGKERDTILGLIERAQANFLSLLTAPNLQVVTAAPGKFDPWLLHNRQQDKIGHGNWRRRSPEQERCYRLVRPIFTWDDLEGLKPYRTPELATGEG